jgi:predicted outer membrane repeat protein
MTRTRSSSVAPGAGRAPTGRKRRAARWGATGAAVTAAVAAGLGGASAAVAAPAVTLAVSCSVTALNNAITAAPSNAILVLKSGCVYSTHSPLSNVVRNLTIVGSNDTIRLTGAGTILNTTANLSLSKLTLTGGDGSGPNPGAIKNVRGTVTLNDVVFRDNDGGLGGAIQNSTGGRLIVTGSTFADNDASTGGGAIANVLTSTVAITSSTFAENTAPFGGAIYNLLGTVAVLDATGNGQTRFVNNDADGATLPTVAGTSASRQARPAANAPDAPPPLTGVGGAIYNVAGPLAVLDATFTGNDADGDGGAIRATGSTSTVSGSTFSRNFADGNGGAISTTKSLNLVNDYISGNQADLNGGGIYVNGGSTSLNKTDVIGNFAGAGGGIYRNAGSVSLTNNSLVTANHPNNCVGLFC